MRTKSALDLQVSTALCQPRSDLPTRALRSRVVVCLHFLPKIAKTTNSTLSVWHNSIETGLPLAGPLVAFVLIITIAA
jgi:hypothetical protein